ncbi:M3 family oligoendopeptidase [Hymenobacter busanensis]|uniref:M3 family oligoendopeptidase n=1 Tax=Hymenobacter busanensis TaxID=2607656 RepID=A0A7L4ZSX3_9BACT|nr:M3 family oligoendopeptidase [Hymenobacter busanensis]KAA9327208.1 M3 family oligoendopeptidase [Hymenobacter busanensis]QHJ05875.1 M3 family oligoendopeptidase [Hymenobacter busanensis]
MSYSTPELTADVTTQARPPRRYLPESFVVTDWAAIEPYFIELRDRAINSAEELESWLLDRSELESVLSEDLAWRYIRMTCDTQDEERSTAFQYFVSEIEPNAAPYDHALNEKLVQSPYAAGLDPERYRIFLRSVRRALEIYRAENIPLKTDISTKQQQYAAAVGAMTVTLDGEEMTLQRASDRLKDTDRAKREEAWRAVQERRAQDVQPLDALFAELVQLRHQMALNADFPNFRDYMFAALGRFDYTPQDCFDFHQAIHETVVPLIDELDRHRRRDLGLSDLRPWDLDVDVSGKAPLRPFGTGQELLEKTITVFQRLDPFLGDCLTTMRDMGHLDLESRKGKAPGGYNYPLDETGVPFIFMNATSSLRDVITMLHEGGHAVHSFLTRRLPMGADKHPPSEVAELASMSMELISMDHWDVFFQDADELRRAKQTHLESVLETFPWVATIDKFQHWVYENPTHTSAERQARWVEVFDEFNQRTVNWQGLENYKPWLWQKQLHLYEVPFYYIEYAMAQLGAIAVWRNFRHDPKAGLEAYKRALALGYTASIGEIYEAAGIRFDFSTEYLRSLADFVREEMAQL